MIECIILYVNPDFKLYYFLIVYFIISEVEIAKDRIGGNYAGLILHLHFNFRDVNDASLFIP